MSKEITIKLSKEQEEFLKKFNTEHFDGSDNNLCTAKPFFFVQTRDLRLINEEYEDYDKVAFYIGEWAESYDTPEELVEAYFEYTATAPESEIVSFQEAYANNIGDNVVCDYDDYFNAYGIYLSVDVAYYKYYYKNVALFFIKSEAESYMEYQKHNLSNPRIYANGCGYANKGEYNYFYDLLMSMGQQLNTEQN